MKARQTSEDFKPIDMGAHPAVCYLVVDLGMQPGGKYAPAYKVALGWQLPGQLTPSGERMTITQIYTSSMNKKSNIRKLIESWFGKAFPDQKTADEFAFERLIGRACLLNVTHTQRDDKIYANVGTVMPLPAGMEVPTIEGDSVVYDETLEFNLRNRAYGALPEWLRKKVDAQLRPSGDERPAQAEALDDDIPF